MPPARMMFIDLKKDEAAVVALARAACQMLHGAVSASGLLYVRSKVGSPTGACFFTASTVEVRKRNSKMFPKDPPSVHLHHQRVAFAAKTCLANEM